MVVIHKVTEVWTVYYGQYSIMNLEKLQLPYIFLNKRLMRDEYIKLKKIKLQKKMKYHELRYYNTLNCINLTDKLISNFIHKKKINLKRQKSVGRYYTAMPSSLKDYCIKKFERHTNYL